jgi:hypothetical protein
VLVGLCLRVVVGEVRRGVTHSQRWGLVAAKVVRVREGLDRGSLQKRVRGYR